MMKSATPSADLRLLAEAFRALSNPNRLAMYRELLKHHDRSLKSCALQDLVDRLDIGAPTISHHTHELVSAGLVDVERAGRYLHCSLNDGMRERLAQFFAAGGKP
ncbi:MAG TPA: metalloregulator ArsR/SmtB family transcription factor [Nevskiaceae bacterium]|nr:metalloregulator ArsR/SmtB family transcription factor [Nevskiaceae bacterium]